MTRHLDEALEGPLAAVRAAKPATVVAASSSATMLLRIARQLHPDETERRGVTRAALRGILASIAGLSSAEIAGAPARPWVQGL